MANGSKASHAAAAYIYLRARLPRAGAKLVCTSLSPARRTFTSRGGIERMRERGGREKTKATTWKFFEQRPGVCQEEEEPRA